MKLTLSIKGENEKILDNTFTENNTNFYDELKIEKENFKTINQISDKILADNIANLNASDKNSFANQL